MKYMVVVNQKFIVAVEANTNSGAEHMILDTLDGIEVAQAFTAEELNTDTFKWFLENGITISHRELHELSANYTNACKEWADMVDEETAVVHEIASLEKKLEGLRNLRDFWEGQVNNAKNGVVDAKEALNMTNK